MDLHAAISECLRSVIMQCTISAAIVYLVLHFHTTARKLRKELEIVSRALNNSYRYSGSLTIALAKAHELAGVDDGQRENAERGTREGTKKFKGAVNYYVLGKLVCSIQWLVRGRNC